MATGELGGRAAEKLFSLSGLFAVYKPKGATSAAVLNLLKERLLAGRRAVGLGDLRAPSWVLRWSCNAFFPFLFAEAGVQTKDNKRKKQALKIGHGGTLDSAATGVLGNEQYKCRHRTWETLLCLRVEVEGWSGYVQHTLRLWVTGEECPRLHFLFVYLYTRIISA